MDLTNLTNALQTGNSDFNFGIPTIGGMSEADIQLPPELQAEWDKIGQTLSDLDPRNREIKPEYNPATYIDNLKTNWQDNISKWTIYGVLLLVIIVAILGLVLPHSNE
jgi:hypothetical protein